MVLWTTAGPAVQQDAFGARIGQAIVGNDVFHPIDPKLNAGHGVADFIAHDQVAVKEFG